MKRLLLVSLVFMFALLSGCSSNNSNNPAAPVADAGRDQSVVTGSTVTLDGSASGSSSGGTLSYAWTLTARPAGSTAVLSSATAVKPVFVADAEGPYVLSLTVNDGTANSDADTVTITAASGNAVPVANAGPDQNVATGATVTLDGSGSSDANGDSLTYSWAIISAPPISAAVLSDSTVSQPTFTADVDGTYVASLIVNDGTVDSAADTVTITASSGNAAPVADAGLDQNVATGATVTLDGSNSSDANGDNLTYLWSFTSLPPLSTAVFSDATASHPTFTADKDGSYVVSLTVNDGTVDSTADSAVITAAPPSPAGTLDTTFNLIGIVTTTVSGLNIPRGVAIQADGKIVSVGSFENGENYEFAVVRYNTDGSLDTSFNADGIVTTPVRTYSYAESVAMQSDGKIVVAGDSCQSNPGVYCAFAVARYNTDGSLDTSFGAGGLVTTQVGTITDWARSVALQTDGKIVVAGESNTIYDGDFAVVRYNADGSLDTTFNGTGKVRTAIYTDWPSTAYGVAIQADGKIIAAGQTTNGVTYDEDFVLVRYNTDGSLDTSFDGDGKVVTDMGGVGGDDGAYAVTIQTNGKILAGGYAYNGSDNDMALARYDSNGALDTSFDGDGRVITQIGTAAEIIRGLAVQSDNRIVAVGGNHNGSNMDFAVVRYSADGSLDTSFSGDGVTTLAIGTDFDAAFDVAIQPSDGKIVVSGTTTPNASDYYFVLARYNP